MKWMLSLVIMWVSMTAGAAPVVKQNDRVVFFGDSITEQRLYTRYVQQYLYCRYPELNLTVFNAGWSGDTAGGGRNRLERDVLYLKPTLVTIFYGMNDGRYTTVSDDIVNGYRGALDGLVKAIQTNGVRAVVFGPGCADCDRSAGLASNQYNNTLAALSDAAMQVAKENASAGKADVHHPMVEFQTKQKAANPGFSMVPDSIHPDAKGHLFMAGVMLKGLGVEPMPAYGTWDMKTGKGKGLKLVSKSVGEIVLETTEPMPAPFWFDHGQSEQVFNDAGLIDLVGQKLTVTGLDKARWRVFIDDSRAAKVTEAELAAGIVVEGSFSPRAKVLHDLIERKENHYYDLWRNVRLPLLATPGMPAGSMDALMSSDDGYQKAIRIVATPRRATISLRRVPEGSNLVLNVKAVSTEARGDGWWKIEGLTDGSREAVTEHCFASATSATDPKEITLDLGRKTRINAVVISVPALGSQHHINVAVSPDGKEYKKVAGMECTQGREEIRSLMFEPEDARFVRLIYPDHYQPNGGPAEVYTSEVEVYPAVAGQ